jgi:hypothetical protein
MVTKVAHAFKLRHPIKRTNLTLSSCHDWSSLTHGCDPMSGRRGCSTMGEHPATILQPNFRKLHGTRRNRLG